MKDNEIKDNETLKELIEKLDKAILRINELEKEVENLKKGSLGTGVYLDGTPDYVKDYINKEGER